MCMSPNVSLTLPSSSTDNLVLKGSDGSIFAVGDCTFTSYAPTAQVAAQEGGYLARVLQQMAKRDALQAELDALKTSATLNKENPAAPVETGANLEKEIKRLERQVQRVAKIRPFNYSHQGSLA